MSKTKLYVIHGWTYTVTPWEKTIDLLKKQDVNVEMLHVPGLTTSSKKVWTIDDYVKWADRNIPDGAVALGHSNGGRILLNLCSEKPEKLKQLILLDAAGVYEVSSKRDVARSLSKRLGFLKKIPGLTKVWHKITGATDYAKAPQNMKETLSNMLESDKKLDLAKVTTPCSILWGEADTVTPPRQAEVMHQKLPVNTLEIYPSWTHAPYISHPAELAKAIAKALKHPPEATVEKAAEVVPDDAAKVSAALAIKRAEKPVLKANGEGNAVAPDVPTKLILRKEGSPTDGMVVSDDEAAAVKYSTKIQEPKKITNTAKVSAALALKPGMGTKKIKGASVPEVAKGQKESKVPKENDTSKETKTSTSRSIRIDEVKFVELEPVVPEGIISSADVKGGKGRRSSKKPRKGTKK